MLNKTILLSVCLSSSLVATSLLMDAHFVESVPGSVCAYKFDPLKAPDPALTKALNAYAMKPQMIRCYNKYNLEPTQNQSSGRSLVKIYGYSWKSCQRRSCGRTFACMIVDNEVALVRTVYPSYGYIWEEIGERAPNGLKRIKPAIRDKATAVYSLLSASDKNLIDKYSCKPSAEIWMPHVL